MVSSFLRLRGVPLFLFHWRFTILWPWFSFFGSFFKFLWQGSAFIRLMLRSAPLRVEIVCSKFFLEWFLWSWPSLFIGLLAGFAPRFWAVVAVEFALTVRGETYFSLFVSRSFGRFAVCFEVGVVVGWSELWLSSFVVPVAVLAVGCICVRSGKRCGSR